jgi:hypothetical protein
MVFAMAVAGTASGIGEAFVTMTYVMACVLAVLSLVVGVRATGRAVPVGRTISVLSIGNDGASRTGAEK